MDRSSDRGDSTEDGDLKLILETLLMSGLGACSLFVAFVHYYIARKKLEE
jgi:hypothetical protein